MNNKHIEAINWNRIEDKVDEATWRKLTEQFWLDTRIPVAEDLSSWRTLTPSERDLINYVFGGLTLLDTLQSTDGVRVLFEDARTPQEEAVLNNLQFMEAVHAKSYSTIFSTFNTPAEIDKIFDWVKENPFLQYKASKVEEVYRTGSPLQRKAASVLLESFLFYSGFYTPLRFLGESRMTNTAEIIKLIIRDESVHGTYIGYKFKLAFNELSKEEQVELSEWIYELAYDLYENETKYTSELYGEIGWVKEVNVFLEYNLNKALSNLGLGQMFSTTPDDVDPIVMNGLSTTTSNHDFFSQVGNGYLLGQVESTKKSDFDLLTSLVD